MAVARARKEGAQLHVAVLGPSPARKDRARDQALRLAFAATTRMRGPRLDELDILRLLIGFLLPDRKPILRPLHPP